jgi:lysophospholipase L1-like esterase
MRQKHIVVTLFIAIILAPAFAGAQINFPKDKYLVGLGDSVAAGEGSLPVTSGYVYDLYDRSVFGTKQEMEFANAALRGARSWDLRDHQVAQVLCAEVALRPTIVTITAGANDFLRGDTDIVSIGWRVADAINVLLNNDSGKVASPVRDPVTVLPCRALKNVTILVSNYYSIPHPVAAVNDQLDAALRGFDQALRFWLQFVSVPAGSKLAVVDLYTPSLGREGLVTVDRRLGFEGPFAFDVHPTNLGHSFIAEQFEQVWRSLN